MINLDVLIKYFRKFEDPYGNWPEKTWRLKERIDNILKGFPGINWNSLSLIPKEYLTSEEIFILDPEIFTENQTVPILMLKQVGSDSYNIIGTDKNINVNWDLFPPNFPVLRVDCRPSENGGPGYHYFNRVLNQ